jgi:hypothetical protein
MPHFTCFETILRAWTNGDNSFYSGFQAQGLSVVLILMGIANSPGKRLLAIARQCTCSLLETTATFTVLGMPIGHFSGNFGTIAAVVINDTKITSLKQLVRLPPIIPHLIFTYEVYCLNSRVAQKDTLPVPETAHILVTFSLLS